MMISLVVVHEVGQLLHVQKARAASSLRGGLTLLTLTTLPPACAALATFCDDMLALVQGASDQLSLLYGLQSSRLSET